MNKVNVRALPHVVDKGLVISSYKGEYQAKRIMMRAGLPADLVNVVLFKNTTTTQSNQNPNN